MNEKITTNNNKVSRRKNHCKSRKGKTWNNANIKVASNPDEVVRNKTNDISWYAPSEQILRDAASISYNYAAGNILNIAREYLNPEVPYNGAAYATPGIMELDTAICPGISESNSSAINIAARQIYSYVRHANSGHSNYDAPDLMMYMMAMDSVYAMFNNLKRLYGVLSVYDIKNRYLPEALVRAMGFKFDNVVQRIPNIRYYLNTIANKINTLCVPAVLNVMVRHSWLFSNVYADSDLPTAQLYVFRMRNYYKYNEFTLPAKLESVAFRTSADALLTFEEYSAKLDEALAAIIESEDFNIMSGDILKAYGEGNLFRVSAVSDDYKVTPVVDANVLLQIDNAIVVPFLSNSDITVNVDTNTILWTPSVDKNFIESLGFEGNWIINTHVAEVTPADTMEATRLMPVCSESFTDGNWTIKIDSCGSDIIAGASMLYYKKEHDSSTNLNLYALGFESAVTTYMNPTYKVADAVLSALTMLSRFKYHPQIRVFSYSADTSTAIFNSGDVNMKKIQLLGTLCDLDHFTVVAPDVLSRLHDTAILGEFGIKSM